MVGWVSPSDESQFSVVVWPEPGMLATSACSQYGGRGGRPAQPRGLDTGGSPPPRPLHWGGGHLPVPAVLNSPDVLRPLLLPAQVHLQCEGRSGLQELPGKSWSLSLDMNIVRVSSKVDGNTITLISTWYLCLPVRKWVSEDVPQSGDHAVDYIPGQVHCGKPRGICDLFIYLTNNCRLQCENDVSPCLPLCTGLYQSLAWEFAHQFT